MKIDATCRNCVFTKDVYLPFKGHTYPCSKGQRHTVIMDTTPICKYWRPSVYDVKIWIERSNMSEENSK